MERLEAGVLGRLSANEVRSLLHLLISLRRRRPLLLLLLLLLRRRRRRRMRRRHPYSDSGGPPGSAVISYADNEGLRKIVLYCFAEGSRSLRYTI